MNIVRARPVVSLVGLLLLISLPACTGMMGAKAGSYFDRGDGSGASSDGFPAPTGIAVWQAAMQVTKERGFTPDPEFSDSLSLRVLSRWRHSMSPLAGKGYREKVDLKVLPVKGRENWFRLETNVTRQMNDNITNPSSKIQADWKAGSRNEGLERLINNTVAMMFLPSDASPEFKQNNDITSGYSRRDPSAKPPPKQGGILEGLGMGKGR